MDIDERLEKLVERHEALTQSVELIASMQKLTEKEIRRLSRFARIIVMDHEARLLLLEGEEPEEESK